MCVCVHSRVYANRVVSAVHVLVAFEQVVTADKVQPPPFSPIFFYLPPFSFPMFYAFEEWPDQTRKQYDATRGSIEGLWSAALNAMGAGMLILCLLDFVRLAVGADIVMKG